MSNLFKRIMQYRIFKAEVNYKKLNPKNWHRLSLKKIIRFLVILVVLAAALIILKDEYEYQFGDYSFDDTAFSEEGAEVCNVSGIELHGEIVTYTVPENEDGDGLPLKDETSSEYIISLLRDAEADDAIKAIIIEIDSYGGSPVASYEINQVIHKETTKPVVAMVRSAATSGAYLVAAAANTIFATPYSDIGSIGITMSYLDSANKNKNEGLTYNSVSTGKYKDYGNPDKTLTEAEKALMMRDLNIIYEDMVKTIASDRHLDNNKVRELADGSSIPGQMAKDKGLIDEIGSFTEVESYLKDMLGEEVEVCW